MLYSLFILTATLPAGIPGYWSSGYTHYKSGTDGDLPVTVDGNYPGRPMRIWAQLSGLRGVILVCESFGRNMLPSLVGQQLPTVKKENIPFEGKRRSGIEIL
jgi:hypothetical protein